MEAQLLALKERKYAEVKLLSLSLEVTEMHQDA